MKRAAAFTAAAVVVGFVFGLAWGRNTRAAADSHVKTDLSGGVVTVQIDAAGAAEEGLANLILGR